MKKLLLLAIKSAIILAAAFIAKLCKISFMVGSHAAYFSGLNSILPLMGVFTGTVGTALLFIARILLFSSTTLYSGQFLAFILPGVSASLYWATNNALVRLVLPLACMVAFIAHPVGFDAFTYSLFWLIPIALYFVNKKSIVVTALASTFIAHAVGSVIWLYTVPMTAVEWTALIPVVIVERALFASGMIVIHQLFSYIFAAIENKNTKNQATICTYNA